MKDLSKKFFRKYNFDFELNIDSLVKKLLKDMDAGLKGEKAFQDMIKTWFDPSSIRMKDKSVIVIDAGGTNFRSCMVEFSQAGEVNISGFAKTSMPGTTGLLTKKQFFNQIADNIERFKDKCSEICFCFSYPMTITENQDGILTAFSKEVEAPEVEGCYIGAELASTLREKGWNNVPRVFLLNDTASALLAGTGDENSSSNVGFILGTGMNAAYIQNAKDDYPGLKKQIIVCETAKFGNVTRSYFDVQLDMHSTKPGTALLEKLCSGAYLGPLALETIKVACDEGLFGEETTNALRKIDSLSLIEICDFMNDTVPFDSPFSFIGRGFKMADSQILSDLFDAMLDRAARISASVISACVIKTEEGTSKEKPVNVLCNGSTFYKAWKIFERTQNYLCEYLESKKIYFRLISKENDITIGTAMAALSY